MPREVGDKLTDI